MGFELIKQFPFVDAVVSGEGEGAWSQFIDNVFFSEPFKHREDVCFQTKLLNVQPQRESGSRLTDRDLVTLVVEDRLKSLQADPVSRLDSLPTPDYGDYFNQLALFDERESVHPRLLSSKLLAVAGGERASLHLLWT